MASLPGGGKIVETDFKSFINNDLDTAKALALIWDILKDEKISDDDKKATILDFDKVIGLELDKIETFDIPEEVQKLIEARDNARTEKDFAKSDELRKEIENFGFRVKDTEKGTVVEPQ